MNKIVTLYRGTNAMDGKNLLDSEYDGITWWSHDYETVDHYYEGCVIKMTIELVDFDKVSVYGYDYIDHFDELEVSELEDYEYGYVDIEYPENARWYSINSKYLYEHKIKIEEIDLKDVRNELI